MINADRRGALRWVLSAAGATVIGSAATAQTMAAPGVQRTAPPAPSMLFGVDYYPDQTPEALWRADAEAMAATGITNVRIGEFAWGLMQPREGDFDLGWLRRSVDLLHDNRIAVILGTPSAAPPPWLTARYPEVLAVNDKGMRLQPGGRRFTCPTVASYRRLSVAVAREMAQAFARHPGVIGWQIDNELTLGGDRLCYCDACGGGFRAWLQKTYGTTSAMNRAWGDVFWSQTYGDFKEVRPPLPSGALANPSLLLDYSRFQSEAHAEFLESQVEVVRDLCPGHFITHNNSFAASGVDLRKLARSVDVYSADNYPGFTGLYLERTGSGPQSPLAVAAITSLGLDYSRSVKGGKPFLVMEQQSGKAGQDVFSPQPNPGQLRLWSFQAIAHGAMGINYFRWDTARFGAEQYWHGLLNHDRSRSPGFAELQRTIAELKILGPEVLQAPSVSQVALCVESDSEWAVTFQPGNAQLKYIPEITAWYSALSAANPGLDVVDLTGDLSRYRVVVAPLLYVLSPGQADRVRKFVENGGAFISGARLGVKEEHSKIVGTALPGLLRDVMGATVADYQPIYADKQAVHFGPKLGGAEAECKVWADILEPAGAEVLATYATGQYSGRAAITSHAFGKGRAIYLGAHLDVPTLARTLGPLLEEAGVRAIAKAPFGVEATMRRSRRGDTIFLLNHNGSKLAAQVAGSATDLLTGETVGGGVDLEPYGARVLRRI